MSIKIFIITDYIKIYDIVVNIKFLLKVSFLNNKTPLYKKKEVVQLLPTKLQTFKNLLQKR